MNDLTQGAIGKHLVSMSLPIMIGMLVHTCNFLVELYFVGQLGSAALAGVSSVGVLVFFVMALTQIQNIGIGTLVSHAVGRKDVKQANLLFHQGLFTAFASVVVLALIAVSVGPLYFTLIAPNTETLIASLSYFYWFLPALMCQFPITVIVATLRGAGVVKQPMMISIMAVLINMLLSPVLITGVGLGIPLGLIGAALASSIAMLFSGLVLCWYFSRRQDYFYFSFIECCPKVDVIRQIVRVGIPAGGELLLTFVYMSVTYWALRNFDPSAQAGFGVGVRVMQALFLPAMAVTLAGPAIAGQNFASGHTQRVYNTYRQMAWMTFSLMLVLSAVCFVNAETLTASFSDSKEVIAVATVFLSFVCFNFIPAGYVLVVSAMFKALGNVWPAFFSTAIRLCLFSIPVISLSTQSTVHIETIWLISAGSVYAQAAISFILIRREFAQKLPKRVEGGEARTLWPPSHST
ncbi:MATE family efflux transporter [Pseudoalteromonas luteoviolacea]|uniref:Multidrug-efflux transporter n=1 Tax=Pseudoalteromonas luteoviolacea S4054 TaxID=1129367 RepID=A0A0F6AHW9_9GAMM|nr:MATE family efflux transporter [Pseudoalteromonas luteoviolacea]AOT09293.1 MATE family efflux transporter [Pseudoalteromonas luteoviolacea]AOT14205.1 MATE family efflux transporter [Pseudoalteromonas luteoviolacea]AOT19121.1 MATE family efflux transporter [Pseudoalteromonas luteoviolacea]KKE84989.1 hypothetical protein N479_06040 [Pseudoalteromonas luteoviolacea S4054]KZN70107.1 hypothetical protein N481_01150 [Pseudoalteromonas luteoviolacea S4047-1]